MEYEKLLLHILTKATARPNQRRLRRDERKAQRVVDAGFITQTKYTIKESNKLLGKKSVKSLNNDIDDIFNDLPSKKMNTGVLLVSSSSMKFGADYQIKKSKLAQFGISFDLKHSNAVQYLQTDRPLVLAKMSQTAKDHIKPLIVNAVKTGQSPQELAKLISKNYAFSRERSLMISVNEIGNAYEVGNFAPIQDAQNEGIDMQKSWLTVGDGKVTPSHTENQKEGWVEVDHTFTGTGDKLAPATDNPRCRCTILYQVKK